MWDYQVHKVGNLGYVQSPGSHLPLDRGTWEILPNIGLSNIDVDRPSLNWHFGLPEI
jgi:hypothetical protein